MTNKNYDWNNTWGELDVKCHTGNTILYTEKDGGSLMIGGWTKQAVVTRKTHVIDLTGLEHKYYDLPTPYDEASKAFMQFVNPCAGWLSLPFPDFGTPHGLSSYDQWHGIAMTIREILVKGNDVLVACHGGHGRSGLFCAIVGYILGVNSNRSWSSPVEHIRKVHCDSAVETYAQEKYVYDILGLEIAITHAYASKAAPLTNTVIISKACPICGINSFYVDQYGMCMGCKTKLEPFAKEVMDITDDDIKHPMQHDCKDGDKCLGIYRAAKCGHTVHNMLIVDGMCENCYWIEEHKEETSKFDETKYGECAICQCHSTYGALFGVCWACQEELRKTERVDYIHDSNLDGYKAVPHYCPEEIKCTGIAAADVCRHVVHNMDIVDGLCPDCWQNANVKAQEAE